MVLLLIKPAKALQKYIKKRKNKIIVFEQRLKEEKHRLMMAIKSQKPFMSFPVNELFLCKEFVLL
jgi:hypothetical protein